MVSTITDTRTTPVHRYVFVYGTLRIGQERDINRLQPTPIFMGMGRISGILYDLGSYPGARLVGEKWVEGEVYQITPELERQLDEIEQVWPTETAEYSRQEVRVKVRVVSGLDVELTCLTYEITAQRAYAMAVIVSGDWLAR